MTITPQLCTEMCVMHFSNYISAMQEKYVRDKQVTRVPYRALCVFMVMKGVKLLQREEVHFESITMIRSQHDPTCHVIERAGGNA